MRYVYLLQSLADEKQHYIGISDDPIRRLDEHNMGKTYHTAKFRPWRIVVTIAFEDEKHAIAFEKYLKSGSGHAFAKRHFWP